MAVGKGVDEAVSHFRRALEDCSNFSPAFEELADAYRQLGWESDLQALLREKPE